jgi:hypothetical protein
MIYLTIFFLTLFLTQITHAFPKACGGPISPGLLTPDPYGDTEYNLQIPSPLRTTYDKTFDNSQGSLNSVACSDGEHGLAARYANFGKLPGFPHIGGAFDIAWNSPNCGGCWQVSNKASGATIWVTAIDAADGFNIAEAAFKQLNGGVLGDGVLEVVAKRVNPTICLRGCCVCEDAHSVSGDQD